MSDRLLRLTSLAGMIALPMAGGLVIASGLAQAQPVVSDSLRTPGEIASNSDSMVLNAALSRLGRNPKDVTALIDAGNAALGIGDVDAAIGFFSRANQVTPGSPRIKAGLARALVRNGNPFDAIPLFEEAERGGAMDSTVALDRGLAYDLIASNAAAQSYYRLALTAGPNDEATRRLAVSLAITGDKRGSASALTPLLLRQDKAAWRARAFSLAILGQTEEAVAVVQTSLPKALATGITPYLRYMPRLTRSQQAAAANFGLFPRAAEIGQDDPRIARYVGVPVRTGVLATADAGLVPRGEPLGRSAAPAQVRTAAQIRPPEARPAIAAAAPARRDSRVAPPEPQPSRQSPAPLASASGAASPIASTPLATAPAPARQTVPVGPPAPAGPARSAPSPTFSLIPGPAAAPVQAAPVPAPAPVPARRPSLSEAFSDLTLPAIDMAPAQGAVDIRRIKPARGAAANATPIKLAQPSHPSRIWVQVATGRDKAALGFDWRRMTRQADAAFKGKRAYFSTWGQTNRLLTGPFESEAAANSFIAQLRRADIGGAFLWTSPAGQTVDGMAGR